MAIITVSPSFQQVSNNVFHPYGEVLVADGAGVFPEADGGRLAMYLQSWAIRDVPDNGVFRTPTSVRFEELAFHFSYSQIFMPLSGTLGLVVAPPPKEGRIDYERVAAFALNVGDIVLLYRGTCHNVTALSEGMTFVSLLRHEPSEGDVSSLEDRPYITHPNIVEQDGRVIEVSLI
jgi:ureidoglycolate hydrolase